MKKEIPFGDLPLKMQGDWTKYLDNWKNEKIEILSIQRLTFNHTETITYNIYYEFGNIVGVADFIEGSFTIDTTFTILTVGEVEEMYNLSTLLKELNKSK